MSRGRKPRPAWEASEGARKAAAAVLHVIAGLKSPTEASQSIGVSINRYYQLEARALSAMVKSLEPLPRGRRTSPAAQVERLARENARLVREASRYQALLRASQRALGLAPAPKSGGDSKGATGGKKARRPRTRAKALIEKLVSPTAPSERSAAVAGGTS
jgi:hypothetical protein